MDRRSREGSLNPMWGKHHTQASKEKISKTQKERYNAIRMALREDNTDDVATNEKVMRLNTLLQNGKIKTVGELNRAIHILFIADKICREIGVKLRKLSN
ncbi:MAG: hypothetical protein E7084_03550 [Bacteroidales bacterium]|nr:hypothetical protein [Bacteroidales bacterium]